jgi:general stress protein YciG
MWNFRQSCNSNHTEQRNASLFTNPTEHTYQEAVMASNSNNPGNEQPKPKGTAKRGFAAMDEATQRAIASKGGQAAHQKGTAHEFDSEEARRAGQKGGEAVSRDRAHMAQIGRMGGETRQSAERAKA